MAATIAHNGIDGQSERAAERCSQNSTPNGCREELARIVLNVGRFYEISDNELYLVHLAQDEDADIFCERAKTAQSPFIFWASTGKTDLVYEPFDQDFGPYNLAVTHQFCSKIKVWLDTRAYRSPDKCIVIVVDDECTKKKLNITLLVAIAAMVLLNKSDQEIIGILHSPITQAELSYRDEGEFADVSGHSSQMSLTLEDCIKGFYAAMQNKFYDYYTFDHAEYLFYESVQSGDLNWIIPGKIIAFAGPCDYNLKYSLESRSPRFYHHYFKDHNVTTIVRLNEPEYKSSGFVDYGFEHYDLIFNDGYPPTLPIASRFVRLVDDADGAVAVHCYAGIGRTGTLIAVYLMARYNFTAQMAVAWTRICRPGSVIGIQQDWLITHSNRFSNFESRAKPLRYKRTKPSDSPSHIGGAKAIHNTRIAPTDDNQVTSSGDSSTYARAEKKYGQAKALLLVKSQRETLDRQSKRTISLRSRPVDDFESKKNVVKKSDLVLDLARTVPPMLNYADIKGLKVGENPKVYRIQDGKYEWKVKFPEPSYVQLIHNDSPEYLELLKERLHKSKDSQFFELNLGFRHKKEEIANCSQEKAENGIKAVPRSIPIVSYSLRVIPLDD